MSVSINGTNGLTFADSTTQNTGGYTGFRNRIVNGAMMIDQRNAGASVSITNTTSYPVDRFPVSNVSDGVVSAQQSSTAPSGFKKSLKITVTTADASIGATQYAFIRQAIEGYNVADLGLGAAGAANFTVSFWVQSSVTGTFGGSIQNTGESRAYAFTYTINSANTWEQKSITITGDTSGTWATDNTAGLLLNFSLGVGSTYSSTVNTWVSQTAFNAPGTVALINTLNATFYITGVQLEKGSVATPFERRPYGTELALCQRYFEVLRALEGSQPNSFVSRMQYYFKVSKRATPTVTLGTSSNGTVGGITVDAFQISATGSYGPYTGDGNGNVSSEL